MKSFPAASRAPRYSEMRAESRGGNTMALKPLISISRRRPQNTRMMPTRPKATVKETSKSCLYRLGRLLLEFSLQGCGPCRKDAREAELRLDNYQRTVDSFMLKLFPNPRIYCSALFIDVAFFPNKNSEKCVVQPIVATGDFRIFQRVAFKGTDRCLALYECTWPETEAADAPTQTPNGSHQYAWLRPRHLWSAQGWNAYQRRTHMQVQDMQRLSKAMMGLVEEDCGPRWWSKRWSKAWDEEAEGGPRVSTRAPDGFPNTKQLERLDEALENAFTRMENTRREKKIKAVMQNERVSGLSFKPPALGVNGGHP